MNLSRLGRLVLFASVCASLTPSAVTAQRRQRDRISREEILASPHVDLDLLQVIRGLRPHFLEPPKGQRTSGSAGATPLASVQVFVDERTQLELDALKTIMPRNVEEIRYLSQSASVARFGPRVNGGALIIKMYNPPKDTTRVP